MLRFTKERCSVKKAVKNTCPARVAASIKGDPPFGQHVIAKGVQYIWQQMKCNGDSVRPLLHTE